MRVLLSASSFHPYFGGPARSVPQLAVALAELGAEIELWAPDGSALTSPLVPQLDGVKCSGGDLSDAISSARGLDLIHDNGIWQRHHVAIASIARENNIPRIVSTRGMLEPWALNHKPLKKRFAWRVYQKRNLQSAALLHATAPSEADQLTRLGLNTPVVIIPNGVEIPSIDHVFSTKLEITTPKTCLFLSRLHPKKGLPLLLQAWALIRPEGWVLHIAGPDEAGHELELRSIVRSLKLDRDVVFVGELEGENKSRALANADLFVLPTHSENFGIVVAEALAHGCPVITTKGAPWEMIVREKCGWWTTIDVDGIADALREATALTRSQRQKMGSKGREVVLRDFDWRSIARQFFAAYKKTLTEA